MPDADELRWLKSTANELNNLLQVISDSSKMLGQYLEENPDAENYLAILRSGVMRAVATTRAMTERIGAVDTPASASPAPERAARPPEERASESAGTSSALPPIEIHNPAGACELILIVDDEEFVTLLARTVLAENGYRVVTAKNGFQALEIYRKLKDEIDLVILDFTMPVMDGADVFAELQHMNPKVPVVLSSGFAEQDRLRSMLARGLRGFIPKPYTQEKLLTQVRLTLDTVKAERGK